MADYKAIKGWTIQTVSSDPSNLTTGQVWYNSTLGKIRGAKLAAGSWASGGNTSSGHWLMDSLFGSQTAAAIAGPFTLKGGLIRSRVFIISVGP